MAPIIPIILFVYARPDHLHRTLESLRANNVPIIYIFSDGAKTSDKEPAVKEVRKIIHEIDWCTTIITERENNLGLGKSILTGVTEVFRKEEMAIVFEDDLICVPGTYDYLCAALEHYHDDIRVMSVTGWTHPLVTPKDITDQPYFDGRAECWVWGTWARVWDGMTDYDALSLMKQCELNGIDIYQYGADLPAMAQVEIKKNIWAVRFLYWHILNTGLCLRPPWSMVEVIGWDSQGTNAQTAGKWAASPLKPCPPIPSHWPEPIETSECSAHHQSACGMRPAWYAKISNPFFSVGSKCLRTVSELRRRL
jgi:hypothetical protein